MKRTAAVALGVIGVCSNVFGGTVLFSPTSINHVQGMPGAIDVTVAILPGPTISGVDAADVLIGSDAIPFTGFEYSQAWRDFFTTVFPPEPDTWNIYPNEAYLSSNRPTPLATLLLPTGTLHIDLTSVNPGEYDIVVDPVRDGMLSNLVDRGATDPLTGGVDVTVIVPEPASVSLLALGALAALRFGRRRSAR